MTGDDGLKGAVGIDLIVARPLEQDRAHVGADSQCGFELRGSPRNRKDAIGAVSEGRDIDVGLHDVSRWLERKTVLEAETNAPLVAIANVELPKVKGKELNESTFRL